MEKIWRIYKKHEEIINYLIVGVCTMIFSLIFYFISTRTFLDPNNPFELQIANLIKWISGVLFAYVTNRIFVFKSKNSNIFKEFVQFTSSRVSTLFLDMFIMWLMVTKMGLADVIAVMVSQVVITVSNYMLSKLFVFKK
ncbi:MAG: GtrA family protein [Oscillospiraceae bacterium]|nr:GtrA family protein [Oscillospiraceae bacterium]